VKEKLDALNKAFELITVLGAERRKYLEDHRDLHKFVEEADEEWMWLQEKLQVVKSTETGNSLSSTQILINKHEQLEDELKFRKPRIDEKIVRRGEDLISSAKFAKTENDRLAAKCLSLMNAFESLRTEAAQRRSKLEDSFTSQQYFADAAEAEGWMKDRMALVSLSGECGRDEASAQALLQRHVRIQEEIKAYEPEVRRLDEITNVLVGKRRFSSFPADMRQKLMRFGADGSVANEQESVNETGESTCNDETDLESLKDNNESGLDVSVGSEGNIEDHHQNELVNELVEKEVAETFTQEIRGYTVRALYPYQSKTFGVERGELLELKEKSNEEWWLVENCQGREGFAPANYLKELGLQRMTKQCVRMVKKTENIRVKQGLVGQKARSGQFEAATALAAATVLLTMDKEKEKKKQANNKLRRKTTSIQPRQLQHLETDGLQKRQVEINFLYSQLLTGSIEKRKQLDNSISFCKWLRKLAELERWVREKTKSLSVIGDEANGNSLLDDPESAKRRHQAFNTDFLANQNEYTELAALAKGLVDKKTNFANGDGLATSSADVKRRQEGLQEEWLKLLELKKYWDNAVKAIQCIDRFNLSQAEANDLLAEKLSVGGVGMVGDDEVKSVRALQSRQDKLERDIGPIESNVNELRKTAEEVCRYFPQETANVRRKVGSIEELWLKLRDNVRTRKAKLDEKHGLERFENEVVDFGEVCEKMRARLSELEEPVDLKQCEEMTKLFEEIEQECENGVAFKFGELKEMSQKQLAKRGVIGSVERINEQLSWVAGQRAGVVEAINAKRKYLDDFQRYLKFKQDAHKFDLLMQDQEAYLQYEDLGSSSEDADALLKRHDEFFAKLNAHDEKMKLLNDQFVKLNSPSPSAKHFAIAELDEILRALAARRHQLKGNSTERRGRLQQSKKFFEYKNECDDLNAWINERRRYGQQIYLAAEQIKSSETFYLIEKYMNKHEALEKEITANKTRLERLKEAQYSAGLVEGVEKNWLELEKEAKIKGKCLQDTKHKADLSASLSDVDSRMKNLEEVLSLKYNTSDLRSVKEALKKNGDLKKQLAVEVELLLELRKATGVDEMNARASETAVREYMERFKSFEPLVEAKQKRLEADLCVQQVIFDIGEEMKWMEQARRQLEGLNGGVTLLEAQNSVKKQAELERVVLSKHKPIIEKICKNGEEMLEADRQCLSEAKELEGRLKEVEEAWVRLVEMNRSKKEFLAGYLSEQEVLDEVGQIEQNIADKKTLVEGVTAVGMSGKDEAVLSKNLMKMELVEEELRTYASRIEARMEKFFRNLRIERKLIEVRIDFYGKGCFNKKVTTLMNIDKN